MKKSIDISSNIGTLFGTRDENLHVLEDGLNVTIDLRSNSVDRYEACFRAATARERFAVHSGSGRSRRRIGRQIN